MPVFISLHIAAGAIGLVSGFTALHAKKGAKLHVAQERFPRHPEERSDEGSSVWVAEGPGESWRVPDR